MKKEVSEKKSEKIEKGDIVLIDLVGRIKSNNKVFDVTLEETAKKEGVYSEKEVYGPRFIVVGEGWLLEGVDKELQNMSVGETKTIELAAKDAFGERNPAEIKTYGEKKLRKQLKIDPSKSLGKRITIGQKTGYIIKVQGGRVRIDHNHPLAGEDIIYEISITKKLTNDLEKIQEFVKMSFRGMDPGLFQIEVLAEDKKIVIIAPSQISFIQGVGYAKFGMAQNIFRFIDNIEIVEFVDKFEKKMFEPTKESET
ncbi:MAG: FKBP-type peptidyl-prolyl cis-trans isomerase [Candidatus Helarchaeota archaeon]